MFSIMLKGKTAIVTGGSRGIGRAICESLAKAGANVALIYRGNTDAANEVVKNLRAEGVLAECFRCQVEDSSSVDATVERIINYFGGVDILVNNAGINRDKLLISMKENDFDEVVGVDLKGAYNIMRRVAPILIRKRSGKIINISSIAGLDGNAGQANYSAAKAGLVGLTKSVAKELASRNICVNAIAPGFIATDMTVGLEEAAKAVPLGRMGRPEEVAALTVFLAGADYITGEVIRIDGGL